MGRVQATLVLNDRMTQVLGRVNRAMGLVLDSFEAVQRASGKSFNTANISAARKELGAANAELNEMAEIYQRCGAEQERLNRQMQSGTSAAGKLLGKVKSLATAYLGMKGVEWVKESLSLFDTQNSAETQLKTVLGNMGASSGAFDLLKEKASALQSTTAYGDEALIGGAAEFATYMSDENAISVMMDTLTNYAAGMSGGGEVGYKEMVDYATGLGKIMTGSYDAMTKKGFEFTDAQKKIIENGTDMEKALTISEVINESWSGLASQMANTPEGKILAMNNAFGDLREELAARIYPAVMELFDAIGANSGSLSGMITGLAGPINLVLSLATKLVGAVSDVYNFVSTNWGRIAPIIVGIASAFALYNAVLLVHKGILAAQSVAKKVQTLREYAQAKAILTQAAARGVNTKAVIAESGAHGVNSAALTSESAAASLAAAGLTAQQVATAGATVAQTGLNTAIWACPLTWVIALVILLIVLIAVFFEEVVGAVYWLCALFKNIRLWLANFGIAVWNSIKNIGLWLANLGLAVWQIIKNVGAWFGNLGVGIWNVLKAACGNIGVAFHNVWVDIQIGFWSMLNVLMQGLKSLAEKANKCLGWLGVDIDTSGFDFASEKIDELKDKKEDYASISDAWSEGFSTFSYGSVGDAFATNDVDFGKGWSEGMGTFDVFEDGWGSSAYNAGAAAGAGIKSSISGALGDMLGTSSDARGVDFDYADALESIEENTSETAENTATSGEELSYLRDIAERDAINRFTTAEIHVDLGGVTNNVASGADLDGLIGYLTDGVAEALLTASEGVY